MALMCRLKYDVLLSMPMDTERESDTFERAVAEVQPLVRVLGCKPCHQQPSSLFSPCTFLMHWCHVLVLQGQRFQVTGPRSFERQYAQLYFSRLMLLYPEFKKQVERKWPGVPCECV